MASKLVLKKIAGFAGAAALTLLIGSPGIAQTTRPTTPTTPVTPTTPSNRPTAPTAPNAPAAPNASTTQANSLDVEFVRMAAYSDSFEIASSQLALQKSNNPEVKQYAQQMIDEHTQSSRQLAQLAAEKGITVPRGPGPFNQAVINQLVPLSGDEFDRAYLEAQANGHLQTVAIYRSQAGQGQDPDLQQFAAQLLPTIEEHYVMASDMSGQRNALNTSGTSHGSPNMHP
ncbi:DUF4142 domain-containing protein [Phormidium tenue FACHB-886]|nr:DUF4142 domain-containing protein [Phormidium tenue FACHB-886]